MGNHSAGQVYSQTNTEVVTINVCLFGLIFILIGHPKIKTVTQNPIVNGSTAALK